MRLRLNFKNLRVISSALTLCIGSMTVFDHADAQLEVQNTAAFLDTKPDYLKEAYSALINDGARNTVLNNMEIVTLALKHDDTPEAADAIDRALRDINRFYGQTEAALKARTLWYEEGSKEFKGEPYERAMAYYYRGMLDLKANDFGNAQASFYSGFIQDAFAEEEQHSADFAMLLFLNAWALECNDSQTLSSARFNDLQKIKPGFQKPDPSHNTLVVVETGKAPRKLADGIGHSKLVYRRGKKYKDHDVIMVMDDARPSFLSEDIFYQASTRGSRPVDNILDGKINYRTSEEKTGDQFREAGDNLAAASLLAGSSELGYAGSAISLLGGVKYLSASNAKPRADTRYWTGLPDKIHFFTYDSRSSEAPEYTLKYLDKTGTEIPEFSETFTNDRSSNGCDVQWYMSKN